MVTRRMSHPEPSRTHLLYCLSRRLSRRVVLCGNSSMLFLHGAMPESFWYLADFSWRNEDSENSCAQSVNEHSPSIVDLLGHRRSCRHRQTTSKWPKAPRAFNFQFPVQHNPISSPNPKAHSHKTRPSRLLVGTPDPRLLVREVPI